MVFLKKSMTNMNIPRAVPPVMVMKAAAPVARFQKTPKRKTAVIGPEIEQIRSVSA